VLVLAGCVPPSVGPPESPPSGGITGTVTRVVDGDTIRVQTPERSLEVRLDGINAPEREECWYPESAGWLRSLIDGETVVLEVTGYDQFGRALDRVWHAETAFNHALVAGGHAIANTPLNPEMSAAETAARNGSLGLWAPDSCGSDHPLPEIEIDLARSVVDPPGPDQERLDDEVIYLVNREDSPIDLSGWVVRDESSRHRFVFPAGSTLGPGETVAVRSSS